MKARIRMRKLLGKCKKRTRLFNIIFNFSIKKKFYNIREHKLMSNAIGLTFSTRIHEIIDIYG